MHRHSHKENRQRYFNRIGIDPRRVVTPDSVHGPNVLSVGEGEVGKLVPDVDALVTDVKNIFLSVTGGDCFPVYFCDPTRPALGLSHSGWRGILGGVVTNTILRLMKEFETNPTTLLACIGPGIRKCHFDLLIGPEALKFESDHPNFVTRQGEKMAIDLPGIIKEQLVRSGLDPANIEDSGLCTFCEKIEYFSYRRDKPKEVEAMVAHMGLV